MGAIAAARRSRRLKTQKQVGDLIVLVDFPLSKSAAAEVGLKCLATSEDP
jgi:hypothetical protein